MENRNHHHRPLARCEGEELADHYDGLTGLPDRPSYERRLAIEAERARRYRYPLGLVLFEVDGLAAVRKQLGDRLGDEVLREIAVLLTRSRFADEAFWIGGEEFALLLPHTDLAGAETAAGRIAAHVSSELYDDRVGLSWGAACDEGNPNALHARAARARLASTDRRRYASAG